MDTRHAWVLNEDKPVLGYHGLNSLLARVDEDVPDGGRGLNRNFSNEIIMMHSWIPMDAFVKISEKLLAKGLQFKLPNTI